MATTNVGNRQWSVFGVEVLQALIIYAVFPCVEPLIDVGVTLIAEWTTVPYTGESWLVHVQDLIWNAYTAGGPAEVDPLPRAICMVLSALLTAAFADKIPDVKLVMRFLQVLLALVVYGILWPLVGSIDYELFGEQWKSVFGNVTNLPWMVSIALVMGVTAAIVAGILQLLATAVRRLSRNKAK